MADRPSPTSGVAPPKRTRWKKGQSGNPKGRPPGTTLERAVTDLAGEPLPGRTDKTRMHEFAEVLFNAAMEDPNSNAAKLVIERWWGKTDRHELEVAGALQTSGVLVRPQREAAKPNGKGNGHDVEAPQEAH